MAKQGLPASGEGGGKQHLLPWPFPSNKLTHLLLQHTQTLSHATYYNTHTSTATTITSSSSLSSPPPLPALASVTSTYNSYTLPTLSLPPSPQHTPHLRHPLRLLPAAKPLTSSPPPFLTRSRIALLPSFLIPCPHARMPLYPSSLSSSSFPSSSPLVLLPLRPYPLLHHQSLPFLLLLPPIP